MACCSYSGLNKVTRLVISRSSCSSHVVTSHRQVQGNPLTLLLVLVTFVTATFFVDGAGPTLLRPAAFRVRAC